MENIEKAQMIAMENRTLDEDATLEIENEFHRRIISNQISLIVIAVGIITIAMLDSQGLRFTIACVCGSILFTLFILRLLRSRNGITAEKVCRILRKKGLTPNISNDEIYWTSNGKECVLRIRSSCQVEIAREYDIPSIPAEIEGNEKAAIETMNEVYLAKVIVREDNGYNKLAFSAEPLCVSARELATYIPICMDILDFAEDRYRAHITEIHNNSVDNAPRKIGFIY